jgi:hypothetical protein
MWRPTRLAPDGTAQPNCTVVHHIEALFKRPYRCLSSPTAGFSPVGEGQCIPRMNAGAFWPIFCKAQALAALAAKGDDRTTVRMAKRWG